MALQVSRKATARGTILDWAEGTGERAGLATKTGETERVTPLPTPLARGLLATVAADILAVARGERLALGESAFGEGLRRLVLLPRRGVGMGGVRTMSRFGSSFGLDSADLVPCWLSSETRALRVGVEEEALRAVEESSVVVVAGVNASLSPA